MTDRRDVRLAVNLTWCVPGEVGGSEEYLVRQLLGLMELGEGWRPTVYAPRNFAAAHPELTAYDGVTVVGAPFDARSRARRIQGEHTWLARRTADATIVHHGGGTVPTRGGGRVVLTIHDLQYRTYPQHFSRSKRWYLDVVLPRSVRRATVVTVPSQYVRGTVVDAFGADPARVVVVPHGIETTLADGATPETELRERYSLGDGPVLVYPAMTHPHKNHRFLVELMDREWSDPDLRLVLIGGAGAAEHDVQSAIAALRHPGRVRRLGRVSSADRSGLVAMSTATVFPSTYEGFGAPVIEAMALGAPVITSDRASLPEVAGDAALVLALDRDAWADAPQRAQRERDVLRDAGRRRVEAFTARRSGEALAVAYRMALP